MTVTGDTTEPTTYAHKVHSNRIMRLKYNSWARGNKHMVYTGDGTTLGLTFRCVEMIIVWSGGPDVVIIETGGRIKTKRVAEGKKALRKLISEMCHSGYDTMLVIAQDHLATMKPQGVQ